MNESNDFDLSETWFGELTNDLDNININDATGQATTTTATTKTAVTTEPLITRARTTKTMKIEEKSSKLSASRLTPPAQTTKRKHVLSSCNSVKKQKTNDNYACSHVGFSNELPYQLPAIAPFHLHLKIRQCDMCQYFLTSARGANPLRQAVYIGNNKYHCLGCSRINLVVHSKQERRDCLRWLVTGEIPEHDRHFALGLIDIYRIIAARLRLMWSRCFKKHANWSNFVSLDELVNLCHESGCQCVITGHTVHFPNFFAGRCPYWALTYDHIIPLSLALNWPWVWSKHNFQVMSRVLNTIKGAYTDENVKEWHDQFVYTNKKYYS